MIKNRFCFHSETFVTRRVIGIINLSDLSRDINTWVPCIRYETSLAGLSFWKVLEYEIRVDNYQRGCTEYPGEIGTPCQSKFTRDFDATSHAGNYYRTYVFLSIYFYTQIYYVYVCIYCDTSQAQDDIPIMGLCLRVYMCYMSSKFWRRFTKLPTCAT